MDIKAYRDKLAQLIVKIDTTIELCEKYGDDEHIRRLEGVKKFIQEDSFQLVVVGEFSRGKSTLVNALLGSEILPSDPNPTTTMLNIVRDGIKEEYRICYKDGHIDEIDRDTFRTMVAKCPTKEQSRNEIVNELYKEAQQNSQIEYAEILIGNDFGKLGVDIVDTPGINDVNTSREEVTLHHIPNSDAAIVVCSATEPLSASEFDFIHNQLLANQVTKLFIAINYGDCLRTEEERQSICSLFEKGLKDVVPSERIYLVSSLMALKYKRQIKGETFKKKVATYEETGFDLFEQGVLDYLANEKGMIKLQKYYALFGSILDEIAGITLENRKNAISLSKENLLQEISKIKSKAASLEQRYKRELENASKELLLKKTAYAKEYEKQLRRMGDCALDCVMKYKGNDMEEMFAIITDTVLPYKKYLQDDFLMSIKNDIETVIAIHTEAFGDEFKEIGVPQNMLCINLNHDNQHINKYTENEVYEMVNQERVSQKAGTSELDDFLIGAAIGVGVVALGAVLISNPALFIGARIIAGLASSGNDNSTDVKQVESNTASQIVITNAMVKNVYNKEIKKCYFGNISEKVSMFKSEYENNIHQVIEQLENDCKVQMENCKKQYELELNDKAVEGDMIKSKIDDIRIDSNKLIDLKLDIGGVI